MNGPSDVSVQVTGTVRINCTVLWDPAFELEVNWKKDNVDLHPDGIKVTIDPIDKFLTIRDLTFPDQGKKSNKTNRLGSRLEKAQLCRFDHRYSQSY